MISEGALSQKSILPNQLSDIDSYMSLRVYSAYVREELCSGTQGLLESRPGSAKDLLCDLGQLTQPLWSPVSLSVKEGV